MRIRSRCPAVLQAPVEPDARHPGRVPFSVERHSAVGVRAIARRESTAAISIGRCECSTMDPAGPSSLQSAPDAPMRLPQVRVRVGSAALHGAGYRRRYAERFRIGVVAVGRRPRRNRQGAIENPLALLELGRRRVSRGAAVAPPTGRFWKARSNVQIGAPLTRPRACGCSMEETADESHGHCLGQSFTTEFDASTGRRGFSRPPVASTASPWRERRADGRPGRARQGARWSCPISATISRTVACRSNQAWMSTELAIGPGTRTGSGLRSNDQWRTHSSSK